MAQIGNISVVVPAYNEADVIARALAPLADAATAGHLEIIVVPNACLDATAAVARDACPAARILETATPGKANAMSLAMQVARGDAIVFLDADLGLSVAAIEALAAPLLAGEADASFGRMEIASDHAQPLVRAFYRGWSLNPYLSGGKFGGVFALSRKAAKQIFPLPRITADDEFISRQISPARKAFVSTAQFVMTAPATLSDLIKIRCRSRRGTRALEVAGQATQGRPTNAGGFAAVLRAAAGTPRRWGDVAVYGAVMLFVRARLAFETLSGRKTTKWERDNSSRANLAAIK